MRLPSLILCITLGLGVVATAQTDSSKIPITTSSEKALEYYLQGRDLQERLRVTEAAESFEMALAEDPNFAMAHFLHAIGSPSNAQLLERFSNARALVGKISEGERLMILAMEAAINGEPKRQVTLLRQLVTAYPEDERAHTALANYYFGQQEYALAIAEYERAAEISDTLSPIYNQLGYSHRFLGDYEAAEEAFKKYIDLIPEDPNPYDSYAELLMRTGRYDESIEYYRKALAVSSIFQASRLGIASNLVYKNDYQAARRQIQDLYDNAQNDGERRLAYAARAAISIYEGKYDQALSEIEERYRLAEEMTDVNGTAGDLQLMALILYDLGRPKDAFEKVETALDLIEDSDLAEEIKYVARRNFMAAEAVYNSYSGDLEEAWELASEYQDKIERSGNMNLIRFAHEVNGRIALSQQDYSRAVRELQMSNVLNAYNLFRLGRAYEGTGDTSMAREYYERAINLNPVLSLNHSLMYSKAKQRLADL
ncbi:MAG: tetratricopeptide repeat protein [Candidatus Zixiibacteriota bacterium]|nr:MAG: tetratricopeptide repeat protein [candidate division Zixibacteria bacterium]